MRKMKIIFFITSIMLSTASLALPKIHLAGGGADCNPATEICIYLSTELDVPASNYYLAADITIDTNEGKLIWSLDNPYTSTYFSWIWGPADGSYTWLIDFSQYTFKSQGVEINVPNIQACQGIRLPIVAGNHVFQITGNAQSIRCSVQ